MQQILDEYKPKIIPGVLDRDITKVSDYDIWAFDKLQRRKPRRINAYVAKAYRLAPSSRPKTVALHNLSEYFDLIPEAAARFVDDLFFCRLRLQDYTWRTQFQGMLGTIEDYARKQAEQFSVYWRYLIGLDLYVGYEQLVDPMSRAPVAEHWLQTEVVHTSNGTKKQWDHDFERSLDHIFEMDWNKPKEIKICRNIAIHTIGYVAKELMSRLLS